MIILLLLLKGDNTITGRSVKTWFVSNFTKMGGMI